MAHLSGHQGLGDDPAGEKRRANRKTRQILA
jgi:hypothetical protein